MAIPACLLSNQRLSFLEGKQCLSLLASLREIPSEDLIFRRATLAFVELLISINANRIAALVDASTSISRIVLTIFSTKLG